MEKVTHEIEPVFDSNSKILILGTIPSPKSREFGFYYGHPQNRFWKVVSSVLSVDTPESISSKANMLLNHNIALWDVLSSCDIAGAADSSIKNAELNDFSRIYSIADIQAVFATGQTAGKLYKKLTGKDSIVLPSTSPANCAMSLEKLIKAYSVILDYL